MPDLDTPILVALIGLTGTILAEFIRRVRAQRQTDADLGAVLHEIKPNSGKSMHDKIDRIERTVDDLRERQSQHGERLAAVEARVGS